jgi:hypothetical protein
MDSLEELLEIIEKSIKQLAAPTAMIVAAYLISKGAVETNNEIVSVSIQVLVLSLSALGYILASMAVGAKKIVELNLSKLALAVVGPSFVCSYTALAIAAAAIGIGKIA